MAQLDLTLDFRSETALFTQIIEQVQSRVLSGELKPGDQLPTVRQLAAELRINFNTVARAYRILDELGLISTQQGRGTYIWEPGSMEEQSEHRRRALEQLTIHFLKDAAAMGFTVDEIQQAYQTGVQNLFPESSTQSGERISNK